MATKKFIFRPSTKVGNYEGGISLRIICNRVPKTVCVNCRVFSNEWDESTQTLLYPTEDPVRSEYLKSIEAQMSSYAAKLDEIIQQLEKSRDPYTSADVVERFHIATGKKAKMLSDFVATFAFSLLDEERFRTSKAYFTASRALIKFNNGEDIPLTKITHSLIKRFETHMKEGGKSLNTISFCMRILRRIYNEAVVVGHIPFDEKPFANVFTGVAETRKRALNANEVKQIVSIDFKKLIQQLAHNPRKQQDMIKLQRAALIFLFGFYAHGMSFVDICYLKKSNIHDGAIHYYRKKTGRLIEVPMNDEMLKIIRFFRAEMKNSEYLFPILTDKTGDAAVLRNQYESALRAHNQRLKKIAKLAVLNKEVSTHMARHSWASISKAIKQPISVISEGLGHSSEKMTLNYLTSFEHSVLKKAGKAVIEAVLRSSGLPGGTS